jgi:UDP-glucuronate decarboxylase
VRKSKTNGANHAAAKPVLVCGGAGFIGSHLCERLLARGERVICLDNFSTSDAEGIVHLQRDPSFEVRQLDVAAIEPDDIEDVSAIYNLACMASPIHYQRSPLETLFTSVNGVDMLLRVAQRCGARIFQASTRRRATGAT